VIEVQFTARIARYSADKSTWYFATLPPDLATDIRAWTHGLRGGWGSIKVDAMIGSTRWSTSIFPDKKSQSFLLPVKAQVRTAEQLADGDEAVITLRIGG
jgi:hypothetical protein